MNPNKIASPARPQIDDQQASKPSNGKGLKQVVARLAKPFKSLASRNDKANSVQPPDLKNKAPTPEMLAKASEQAANFVARYAPKTVLEDIFASPELNTCQLKLTEIKLLIMDIEDRRNTLVSKLADSAAQNPEQQLQIRSSILKTDALLLKTKGVKTEIEVRLNQLFDAKHEKIRNHIQTLEGQLVSSSGSRNLDVQTQLMRARLELLDTNMVRDSARR